jgi:hypothetical protein
MNNILEKNIDTIKKLCEFYKVKTLFAYGSVCTDKFNDESDIDLLISFDNLEYSVYADNYFAIANKFEELFKRPVDLITDKSLSNPYFINSLNKSKKLLYGRVN